MIQRAGGRCPLPPSSVESKIPAFILKLIRRFISLASPFERRNSPGKTEAGCLLGMVNWTQPQTFPLGKESSDASIPANYNGGLSRGRTQL